MICESPGRFTFYYGATDDWTPDHHVEMSRLVEERIREDEENRVFLCERDIPHAFVLNHSEEMAKIMSGWLNKLD
jgi:hypothetical protein